MKSAFYKTAYLAVLILATASATGALYLGVSILPELINIYKDTNGNNMLGAIFAKEHFMSVGLNVIILAILAASQGIWFKLRIELRHRTEFNDEGLNKKYSGYDTLSAKDKAEIDKQKLLDIERILDSATLRQITHKGSKKPDEDIKKLIGLETVKKSMREMAARMEYEKKIRKNKKAKFNTMHMCFMGPPGTGKTSCARIMAGFLYRYGYIKKNQCIEVDGNFLKGNNPGETTKKTSILIRKALGGVLFIDEAYALLDNGANGYGQEAIATIVKEMEDQKDEFIVILAGYDNEMKKLIDSNPGIYSRIKNYLWFTNYTLEELGQIFNFMANEEGFYVPHETIEKFKEKIAKDVSKRNFGNARTVRNYLDKIIDRHAVNLMSRTIEKDMAYTLCPEDIIFSQPEDVFQ